MEDTAANSVGKGAERYGKREEPFRDPRANYWRTKMHPFDAGLPAHHGGGEQGGTASSAFENGRGTGRRGGGGEQRGVGGGSEESFPWVAMRAAGRYFFILSFGDRPRRGRGSCRGTPNGKRLCHDPIGRMRSMDHHRHHRYH